MSNVRKGARVKSSCKWVVPPSVPVCRWFEQDPEELLESVRQCLEEVGGRLGEEGVGRLKGVGITNQRETTIVWDRTTGRPLSNAIGSPLPPLVCGSLQDSVIL